ncbi:hypothetical protein ACFP1I_31690 [Dyadobacter subterraneus]|uniref:Lipocalin-like domain-containing protein n=1 Tax=Dyadobacter subterraneus TaxID=2773304 RepID=A0ABR9W8W9_9BACT|nr:hypothetical protein [Dyadobacter subterraneus]MBE9461882.1 hypothetical protein [Dyadobacter subterraneus]
MRRILLLFVGILAISCSSNEPDATDNFLGTWQTDVQRSNDRVYFATYEISRSTEKSLHINVNEHFESLDGKFEDYVDSYTFDQITLTSSDSFSFNSFREVGNGQIVRYRGIGTLKSTTLTLDMLLKYDDQDFGIDMIIPLTKK